MQRAHYPPGEIIVAAGSYDNAMYIVRQGLVVVGSDNGGSILKSARGALITLAHALVSHFAAHLISPIAGVLL